MKDQIHCQTSFAPAAAAIRRGCSPLGLLRRQARSMPASAWKGPHNAMRMWPDGLHAARFQRLCTSGWAPQHCYGSPQLAPNPPSSPLLSAAMQAPAGTGSGHGVATMPEGCSPATRAKAGAWQQCAASPLSPWLPGAQAGGQEPARFMDGHHALPAAGREGREPRHRGHAPSGIFPN